MHLVPNLSNSLLSYMFGEPSINENMHTNIYSLTTGWVESK